MGGLFSRRKKSVNLSAITNDSNERKEPQVEARHFHDDYKNQKESDFLSDFMAERARASEQENSTREADELAAKETIFSKLLKR
ncbi:unnamed protein product [Allacma fusca]|uniref:Uncharacterized protein n=1 Tax=Allacma fusca TaxID=39272 RepID=A0A8J2PLH7_9HEXA|nr:unnamed protein product [Allacma fusca]